MPAAALKSTSRPPCARRHFLVDPPFFHVPVLIDRAAAQTWSIDDAMEYAKASRSSRQ